MKNDLEYQALAPASKEKISDKISNK